MSGLVISPLTFLAAVATNTASNYAYMRRLSNAQRKLFGLTRRQKQLARARGESVEEVQSRMLRDALGEDE